MDEAERVLTTIEDNIGVEAAAILNSEGGIVASHIPEEEQDVIQSLLFSLGGTAISSFIAEVGGKVVGLKKAEKFMLAIMDRGDIREVHAKLERGMVLLKELIKEGVKEGLLEVTERAPVHLTPAARKVAMEMRIPAEYVAFSVPTRKIFTLEFMESRVSRELVEKYGGWVMDLFMMIDGEKSVGALAEVLGRDLNEVVVVVGELLRAKAVTIKRIDMPPLRS
ncbi:MAG: hypothetical protein QXX87_01940 [Candidatus Jordarchaeales archaeon]